MMEQPSPHHGERRNRRCASFERVERRGATPPASPREVQLIRKAQRRDGEGRAAFDELVLRHQGRLVRLMRHLTGDTEAEDMAQEAFVRAYMALDHLLPNAPLWPWLRTIATRLAYNRRRDTKTRKHYEHRVEALRCAKNTTSDKQTIERVFDRLSHPQREILVLRYVEELSVERIAKMLGLGKSAAKMRVVRARAQFKVVHDQLTK